MKKSNLRAATALQALAFLGAGVTTAFIAAAPAAAQEITAGSVSGQVVDQNGAPVANALVTVTGVDRSITRTVTTGTTGTFTVPQLPLGRYSITATAAGFDTTRIPDADIALGGTAYELRLQPASAAAGDEIVVTARAARKLDFSDTATGVVLDVQEVANRVPVVRSIEGLAILAPQTVVGDPGFGNLVALSGSSVAENIYYINGMNITNFRNFLGGSTVPFEFYDQVQVKTGGYQAEFGRSTGGALIALTRSGSNEFRGGANVSFAPASMRAKQPDSYISNNAEDRVENIEGNVWASGPIVPDRAYFFAFVNPRYENQRYEQIPQGAATSFTRTYLESKTPFYGGKLDIDLFDGHRLEGTYFNDSNTDVYRQYTVGVDDDVETPSAVTRAFTGGKNYIGKYTGQFTDWLTLSLLYGKSKYDRTTAGTQDDLFLTYDSRQGISQFQFLQGGVAEAGTDKREVFRGDIDLFVNLMGAHHIRVGADHEILNADSLTFYSGGGYNRIFNSSTYNPFGLAPNTPFLRQRVYNSGGAFELQNTAYYIQDNWDITDRLQLSLGLRNDRFKNLNAAGKTFVDLKNQWSPRLGVTYDLFGDRRTKLSGFYGRYYLPVAANTNIRLSGDEIFTERWYQYSGNLLNPTLGAPLTDLNVFSDSSDPDPTTLVSTNLKPQHMDEFIIGAEHRFGDRWRAGINLVHRNLKSVLEDADVEIYALGQFCAANPDVPDCEDLSIGGGGYVLYNPGSEIIINVAPQGDFPGGELTFTTDQLDLPKAKRKYWGVELSFDRSFDGKWGLAGSYTWSKTRGNYEGGVKSDNDQDDVGLTQDFDEPGWMDGSFGYLPNDRRHSFKLYGSYAPFESVLLGFNARVVSPKRYGCVGIYPFDDGRAQDPTGAGGSDSWYCGDRDDTFIYTDADGNETEYATGSVLVGRGGGFKGEWEKRIDLSAQYKLPLRGLRNARVRVDLFNAFNFDSPTEYVEVGDADGPVASGTIPGVPAGSVPLNPNYGEPTAFQAPRYVRFGLAFDF